MNRKQVAEVKRQHEFRLLGGGDQVGCSCGWQYNARVGAVRVARDRHKMHVQDVLDEHDR